MPETALIPSIPRRQKWCRVSRWNSWVVAIASDPTTSGRRSSIAPTTVEVENSSVASPQPTKSPATTFTKIQLRIPAPTTRASTERIGSWLPMAVMKAPSVACERASASE